MVSITVTHESTRLEIAKTHQWIMVLSFVAPPFMKYYKVLTTRKGLRTDMVRSFKYIFKLKKVAK